MATDTKTKDRTRQTESVAKPPDNKGSVAVIPPEQIKGTWENFQSEIRAREREIVSLLPSHITKEKFINTAIAAVKQNPTILQATQRSLFAAIIKSAQDGIMPDGKEGFINTYNTKVSKRGEQDRYELVAQWSPMAYGLRKRARELDGILIDAQVVYKNDLFKRVQGDDPKIIHEPVAPGEAAGQMIATYAIFKREDGTILGREVMDAAQVAMVRAQSKAPDSLMWTKFETEGWRKSVIRRGMKSVPVSEKLENIIKRDDEAFDFSGPPGSGDVMQLPAVHDSEFARGPARQHKILQEWTAKGNFAKTEAELEEVHKGAMAALPEELKQVFSEFVEVRHEQIARSKASIQPEAETTEHDDAPPRPARKDFEGSETKRSALPHTEAGEVVIDADYVEVTDGERDAQDAEDQPDHGGSAAAANADTDRAITDWYEEMKTELPGIATIKDIIIFRDNVVLPQLPEAMAPAFIKLCDARVKEIVESTRRPKK